MKKNKAQSDSVVPNAVSHTPTPWSLDRLESGAFWNIGNGKDDIAICQQLVGDDIKQSKRSANAAFIVRAVNSHEALLNIKEALKNCLDSGTLQGKAVDYMRRQIAQAEGK